MLCGFLNSRYLDALHLADEWGCIEKAGGCCPNIHNYIHEVWCASLWTSQFVQIWRPRNLDNPAASRIWGYFYRYFVTAESSSNSNIAASADAGSSSDASPCFGSNIAVSFNSVAKLIADRRQIPGKTARESTGVSSRPGRQYPLAANPGRFQS